jgi:hypothetical protein
LWRQSNYTPFHQLRVILQYPAAFFGIYFSFDLPAVTGTSSCTAAAGPSSQRSINNKKNDLMGGGWWAETVKKEHNSQ